MLLSTALKRSLTWGRGSFDTGKRRSLPLLFYIRPLYPA